VHQNLMLGAEAAAPGEPALELRRHVRPVSRACKERAAHRGRRAVRRRAADAHACAAP
jgi:hypothetical protein